MTGREQHMIVVTGASGHLGRLVVQGLLEKVPAERIVAAVRTPEKAPDLAERGVTVRKADYNEPATLASALAGPRKSCSFRAAKSASGSRSTGL